MGNKEEKKERKEKIKAGKQQSELVTKESFSAVCALFSLVALLILCTRSLIFGEMGIAIHSFFLGALGYMSYPVMLCVLYVSVTSLFGKRFVKNRKAGACVLLAIVCATLVAHLSITYSWGLDSYAKRCFFAGETPAKATIAGWLGAVVLFAVASATTKAGTLVIFSVLTVFFAYLSYVLLKKRSTSVSKAQAPVLDEASDRENQNDQAYLQTQTQGQAYNQTHVAASDTQRGQAFVSAAPVQPEQTNGYYDTVFGQRPAVSLSDERLSQPQEQQTPTVNAFSPFGTPQTMQQTDAEEMRRSYENSKEFLFGATPAENYKRNLIFDPNARVNQRSSARESTSTSTTAPMQNGAYTKSYSEAYQSSVNQDTGRVLPTKVFTDYAKQNEQATYQPPKSDLYSLSTEERVTPVQPNAPSNVNMQQPVERSAYAPQQPQQDEFLETSRETPIEEARAMPAAYEDEGHGTPLNTDADGESRHAYMHLFSTSNPRVFGEEERADVLGGSLERDREETARETYLSDPSERERDFISERVEEQPNYDSRGALSERLDDERPSQRRGIDIFDREAEAFDGDNVERTRGFEEELSLSGNDSRGFAEENTLENGGISQAPQSVVPPKIEPAPIPKPRVIRPYVRVPLDDFDCRDIEPTANFQEIQETKENIIATLEDFNVTGATIASVTNGPTVTRYNVTLPRSIPPKKVVSLDQSIALSLHASGVNIYPNYEDGVVSIEVPHKPHERQFVQLGCMLTGDTFVNAKSSSLMFAMGKDVGNRKVYGDISKMIHLLVAGSSGSGKSVFLGSLIVSMIYKYSPEELRLILIDPKKTEFVLYNNLPHLMINEIITDVNKAVQSLNWAIGEMNRRYGLFEQMSRAGTYVVNLDAYNAHVENKEDKLPKIVIIIDELADLMLAAKKEIEDRIQNLTQKARAAGIHLIVATQRPSTDVITGVIKSNLATRIAFAVATDVDSRVILDQSGAQNLLGKGDFLYTMQGINTPVRVQSAFISSEDSQRVVNFIKANNEAYYDETATSFINNTRGGAGDDSYGGSDEVEGVYIEALRYVILSGSASISMIQRKCSVGYNKAGKIVEWMEDMGYISSFDGAKARKVLITKEEFESKYGSL